MSVYSVVEPTSKNKYKLQQKPAFLAFKMLVYNENEVTDLSRFPKMWFSG